MNQYPAWKYLLIFVLLVVGIFYALPNLYVKDPAVQISSSRGAELGESIQGLVETSLGRLRPEEFESNTAAGWASISRVRYTTSRCPPCCFHPQPT